MCHQPTRLRCRRKINLTRRHRSKTIAKASGYALKQGSKPQSSQRQSNLQRQKQAALMPCRMRMSQCTPVCKINYLFKKTKIEKALEVRKKLSFFVTYRSPAKF